MEAIDEVPGEGNVDLDEVAPTKKGPRDRSFNPWRYALTDKAKALVAEAIGIVEAFEDHRAPRKRRRKERDQATFEATVEAILCDLINHHVFDLPKRIYVSRSGQVLSAAARYKAPAINKKLPDILDKVSKPEVDYVRQVKGYQGTFGVAARTTIEPGERLLDRINTLGITAKDIGQHPPAEIIYLRAPKTDPKVHPPLVNYTDTPSTDLFREQMRAINAWLADVDIGLDPDLMPGKPVRVDPRQRSLRRMFTRGKFSCGGRLYGGFWIPLNKQQREAALIIQGEAIVELDYGQMAPRLFYAMKGIQPPDKDLYAIPGYERQRDGIKKVMNSMFFRTSPITQMPQGVRPKFESKHDAVDVAAAIMAYHPGIADLFFRGLGHEAQFMESEIMVAILLELIELEIVALPIHDAILVRESDAGDARQVMLDVFKAKTGTIGYVD
ncbi:hypothetical protein [Mesorhizobium marinum]|uniref:hypothetical protein n=1 Tax=Mesorhizobium marinum TaxID=3228790 RepID=UPI00346573EB